MTRLRTHHRTMLCYARAERHYTRVASLRYEKTLAHREDRANGKALVAEGLDEYALPLHPDELRLSPGLVADYYAGNPLLVALHNWVAQEQEINAYRRREPWSQYPGYDVSIDTELATMLRLCCQLGDPADGSEYFWFNEHPVYFAGALIGYIRYDVPDMRMDVVDVVQSLMKEEHP